MKRAESDRERRRTGMGLGDGIVALGWRSLERGTRELVTRGTDGEHFFSRTIG
jgi:hypothetical protein